MGACRTSFPSRRPPCCPPSTSADQALDEAAQAATARPTPSRRRRAPGLQCRLGRTGGRRSTRSEPVTAYAYARTGYHRGLDAAAPQRLEGARPGPLVARAEPGLPALPVQLCRGRRRRSGRPTRPPAAPSSCATATRRRGRPGLTSGRAGRRDARPADAPTGRTDAGDPSATARGDLQPGVRRGELAVPERLAGVDELLVRARSAPRGSGGEVPLDRRQVDVLAGRAAWTPR